jgi:integrase
MNSRKPVDIIRGKWSVRIYGEGRSRYYSLGLSPTNAELKQFEKSEHIPVRVNRAADLKRSELQNPTHHSSQGRRFNDATTIWLSLVKQTRSYRTWESYDLTIRHWKKHIQKNHPIKKIGVEHFTKFAEKLRATGMKETSIETRLVEIRAFFRFAYKEGWLDKPANITINIPPETEIRPYSPTELRIIGDYLIKQCIKEKIPRYRHYKDNHYRIHMFLSESGLKAGELWELKLDQINLEEQYILVVSQPRGSARREERIPLVGPLLEFVKKDFRGPQEVWVLDDGKGNRAYKARNQMSRAFRRILNKMGITARVKPLHAYRASVATRVTRSTDLKTAQKALRHKHSSTTSKYVGTGTDEDVRNAFASMER